MSCNKLVIRENKEILVSPYFPEYLIDKIAIKNQNRHSRESSSRIYRKSSLF